MVIFDFNVASDISNWRIVNDVVMGGNSTGNFHLNDKGYGVFSGTVSLENNGGFSLVRYRFNKKNIEGFQKCIIKLKGDGKQYQFRVKSSKHNQESYKTLIKTSGEWQTIEISLADLMPVFRGQLLNLPNFNSLLLEEVGFLIGNKKHESFKLIIDYIILH